MRTRILIVLGALFALASFGVSAADASGTRYAPPEDWKAMPPIRSMETGRCIGPASLPLKNGTELIEVACSNQPGWELGQPINTLTKQKAPEKQIRLLGTSYCIGIKSGAYDYAHLWQCENWRSEVNTSQMWEKNNQDTGGFTLKNKSHQECLYSYKDWSGVVPQYTLTSCTPYSVRKIFSNGRD